MPEGEGGLAETFFNPEREGWLTKEGGKYKSKHKRWFILKEGMLYYFKQPSVSTVALQTREREGERERGREKGREGERGGEREGEGERERGGEREGGRGGGRRREGGREG